MVRTDARVHPRLAQLLRSIWSCDGDVVVTLGRSDQPGLRHLDSMIVVPGARSPRFLVPRADTTVMAASLTAYNRLRPGRTRLLRSGLAAACRLGLAGRAVGQHVQIWTRDQPPHPCRSLLEHLRRQLDRPDLQFALGMGTLDRHYKPTLQLFGADARPAAFAKLGWTPPTAALTRREIGALNSWRSHTPAAGAVRVPAILADGEWVGAPYLVTAPLPLGVRPVAGDRPPSTATRSIAGPLQEEVLRDSTYWGSVETRLDAIREHQPGATTRQLESAMLALDRTAGNARWRFGRWHGDWVPWNMARHRDELWVWDWEHSTALAPWGFDAFHWAVTVPHVGGGRPYPPAVSNAVKTATEIGARTAPQLGLAYLIEMMLRSLLLSEPGTLGHTPLYPGLDVALESAVASVQHRS